MPPTNRWRVLLIIPITVAIMLSATFASFATAQASPNEVSCRYYKVKWGDTLSAIGLRFGVSTKTLQNVNNLRNRNRIYAGQWLCIPRKAQRPTPAPPPNPWTDPDAAIEVFSPVAETIYHSPIEINGYSLTFEGHVNIRLLDADGNVIAERYAIGGGVEYDFFHTYIRFDTVKFQDVTLQLFETDAKDGGEVNLVEIPIRIVPGQRFVDVSSPQVGQDVCGKAGVSGYSDTFEANVVAELRAGDGSLIEQIATMGGAIGLYREFEAEFAHTADASASVLVSATEISAVDGVPIDMTVIPITLHPADSQACK